MSSIEKNELHVNQLIAAYNVIYKNGDYKNARKVKDLYQKYCNQHKSISFVGHFSAGKSSFINALLGEDILPESPIPTSANIVQITSGQGNVKVFFNEKEPEIYNEPYDIDMIKDYCMKKGMISRIEISTSQPIIPEKWAFLDTPGIDAADDADRLITESSLHLVDMFVYIMDYNHVQSEANMYFLQHIQAIGIPFFIIINQIDKHNVAELAFSEFEKTVKQTFDQWRVYPQQIFYTSMIDPDMPHNQFMEAKHKLMDLMMTWNNTSETINRSFTQVSEAHFSYLQNEFEKEKGDVAQLPDVDAQSLASVEENLKELQKWPDIVYQSFLDALQTSLKNAYVMPASMRDKAKVFLESQQNDFKVGILGSKKKTNEAKRKRTEDFLSDLNKSIQATIQWKVRDKFLTLLTDNNIHDTRLMDEANHIAVVYTTKDLLKQLKPGAKVNGNYVLRYTEDVSLDIKQQFKANVQDFLQSVYDTLATRSANEIEPHKQEKEHIESALNQKQLLKELTTSYQEKQYQFTMAVESMEITDEQQALIDREEMNEIPAIVQASNIEQEDQPSMQEIKHKKQQKGVASKGVHHVIQSLDKTMEVIESLPGFQSYIKKLTLKQAKLQDRSVTIALFGAFSAGKSSFANALLGDNILPSSPQPTTAVINRILPVTDTHEHGTVSIQYKDEATLFDDIVDIVKDYTPEVDTLEELINWIENHHIPDKPDLSDIYRTYLRAILTGYNTAKHLLGKQESILISALGEYLTEESISCFLEVVDVYYQCALTDQQITLVDTPGADSVNRRHTNVAFNYIKHADAIFYVTYYNHALSRADKAFLTQLGRVKDVFQLDKMFFIINATDLAQNDTDLKLVENYVEEQLIELGIRFPAIFPISSKQALASKQAETALPKEMNHFEQTFYEFIHHDLPALSIQSAFHDIKRVYQALQSYLETIELNQEGRVAKREAINQEQTAFNDLVNHKNTSVIEKQFIQKVEKQLYYVEERMQIQFHDMFKETYNPTTVTESGRAGQKQLITSLHTLLDDVAFDLVQEMQAVSLRVEAYIQTLLHDFYEEISHLSQSISKAFLLPQLENMELEAPEYERAFKELDIHLFHNVFSMYKGTRAFFEKNEKEAFREALYAVLKPIIHDYVTTQQTIMIDAYQKQLMNCVTRIKTDLTNEFGQYVANHITMLSDTIDKVQIVNKKQELEVILS